MDSLADTMWQHAISLIKYAGKRGTGVAPVDTSNGLSIKNVRANLCVCWDLTLFNSISWTFLFFFCHCPTHGTRLPNTNSTCQVEQWYQAMDRNRSLGIGSRSSPNVGHQSPPTAQFGQGCRRKLCAQLWFNFLMQVGDIWLCCVYKRWTNNHFCVFKSTQVWRFLGESVRVRSRQPNSWTVWSFD